MRVLRFISAHISPYRKYIWRMMVGICAATIVDTLLPLLLKQLIDVTTEKVFDKIGIICFYYGLLSFIRVASWALQDNCQMPLLSYFRIDIATFFMKKLYDYPYTFFQNNLSGQLSAKLNDAAQLIPRLIFVIVEEFIHVLLTLGISLWLLWSVQPIFAFIMMVWITLFLSINFFCRNHIVCLVKNYAEERSRFLGKITDYLINIFTVKTFVNKNFELQEIQEKQGPFIKATYKQLRYLRNFYVVQGSFASIYAIGYVYLLALSYQQHLITAGGFALVITTNFNVLSHLFRFSHTFRDFLTDWGTVDQALKLFEDHPQINDSANAQPLTVTQGRITIDKIDFCYNETVPLIQNLSLTIEPGQKIGLVGYSGGGKSTLVNLLLRLYELQKGHIFIDGQDIQQVTQDSLRKNIGLIPQNPSLFHRSVGENIRYGRPSATDDEVQQAAKNAGAHSFIMKLPQGYDSLVGERGLKLSGGQMQRIAIARAFLKNPPILILDEATSQLDSLTESDIQDHLWQIMQGKTAIVIAHRLSTLLQMDRLIVMERGKIIQQGSHEQLLTQEGLYKTLWHTQAGGFLDDKSNGESFNHKPK